MPALDTTAVFSDAADVSYFGGKAGSGVFQTLINLMPPHDIYVEPFLGGGAVMRMKRPAGVNIGIDLHSRVISAARESIEYRRFERVRPNAPEPAIEASSAGNGVDVLTAGNGVVRSRAVATHGATGEAADFRFLCECGIGWLETAMADPHVGFGDGARSVFSFDARTLVYCDPPYLHSTRASAHRYAHEMTDLEHRRLLRVLRSLKCMVMISGYSSALYASELKGWNATAFQAATRGAPAAEWVWYNFDRPVELHDYRFLGRDFRERERIRRQQRRWAARLARMPLIERQALLAAISGNKPGGRQARSNPEVF